MLFSYFILGVLMVLYYLAQDPKGKTIFGILFIGVMVINILYVLGVL